MFRLNFLISVIVLVATVQLNANGNVQFCANTQSDDSSSSSDEIVSKEPCFDLPQYNKNKRAEVNKPVELECVVKNKGTYSVIWMYENQLISLDDKIIRPDSNIQMDTDLSQRFNLKLGHVDTANKGAYKCQISTLVAKNLDYNLDILVPPTISRIPSSDIIVLNEGESITVQCLTQGNPKPHLTWSKRGVKPDHTTIDESKSTLNLENVDVSHSDSYSCIANNDVGIPVTSEFQILIRFKPKIVAIEDLNMNKNVMYSGNGKKETLKFSVDSYPMPRVSLLLNDKIVSPELYSFDEVKENGKQYELTYSFTSSADTIGDYTCIVENEIGMSKSQVKVVHLPADLVINTEKLPIYSDAVVFEWSVFSGTPIQELNVQYFTDENVNGTNLLTKTKQTLSDGTELQPTYQNENSQYKDYYEITKLKSNTTYTIRIRVRNELTNEWSDWSQNLTVRTHLDDAEKSVKHKQSHHHRFHDRKHKQNGANAANLNTKRDRFNSYMSDSNSASFTSWKTGGSGGVVCSFFIIVNTIASLYLF